MQPPAGAGCKAAGWRYYLRFITMCLVLHWGSFQPLDDLKLPTRSLWQYQRKYYFIYSRLSRSAEHSKRIFTGRGRNGKRHVAAVGLSPSRSDYKSAEHKKSSSGATWIFCMEPNCFGVTRGVQPLVCNGDDRGQRPKQGGAVGAAACRMRVPRKAQSRRREPQPAASRASKVAETLPR